MGRLQSFLMIVIWIACGWLAAEEAPLKPNGAKVKELLAKRCNRWKDVKTLYVEFERRTINTVWNGRTSAKGSARYIYPKVGRLDIQGDDAESIVLTRANKYYNYQVRSQYVDQYDLPSSFADKPLAMVADSLMPIYVWLMPLDTEFFERNFELSFAEESPTVIRLKGRTNYAEYSVARFFGASRYCTVDISLDPQTLHPKRIAYEQNKSVVDIDFKKIYVNLKLQDSDFEYRPIERWQFYAHHLDGTLRGIETAKPAKRKTDNRNGSQNIPLELVVPLASHFWSLSNPGSGVPLVVLVVDLVAWQARISWNERRISKGNR